MKTTALVSVEEYLSSVYEPECDYVDGQLENRNPGEKDHSKLQFRMQMVLARRPDLCIFPEVRIQVSPTRFRVPDVAVYLSEPSEQVFTAPPYLVIEILSPEDRWSRTLRKLEDYARMGCANIWVLDPFERKAHQYRSSGVLEVQDALSTTDGVITVTLNEIGLS
ncbi:MAG: Uma2 family endonuclease [Bryobacterales bacterium]|nr:Uma2 family endonuclease [Bryobacterales bacterium]